MKNLAFHDKLKNADEQEQHTARSKGMPGLKYLAVSLKVMTYGDSTILIPVFSASTRSLPVEDKHRGHRKVNTQQPQRFPEL